jgi:hypothetical protein
MRTATSAGFFDANAFFRLVLLARCLIPDIDLRLHYERANDHVANSSENYT